MKNTTPYPNLDQIDFGIVGDIAKQIIKDTELDFVTALSILLSHFSSLISDKIYFQYGEYKLSPALHISLSSNTTLTQEEQCLMTMKEIMSITEYLLNKQNDSYQKLKVFQQKFNNDAELIWQIRDKSIEDDTNGNKSWNNIPDKRMLIIKKLTNNSSKIDKIINDSFLTTQLSCFKQSSTLLTTTDHQISYLSISSNQQTSNYLKKCTSDNIINKLHLCIKKNASVSIPQPLDIVEKQKIAKIFTDIYYDLTKGCEKQEITFNKIAKSEWDKIYQQITSEKDNLTALNPNAKYHILKLAMVFCSFEKKSKILKQHILRAYRLYQYNIDSINYLLCNSNDNISKVAPSPNLTLEDEKILNVLEQEPVTKSKLHKLIGKNTDAKIVNKALEHLVSLNLITWNKIKNSKTGRLQQMIALKFVNS